MGNLLNTTYKIKSIDILNDPNNETSNYSLMNTCIPTFNTTLKNTKIKQKIHNINSITEIITNQVEQKLNPPKKMSMTNNTILEQPIIKLNIPHNLNIASFHDISIYNTSYIPPPPPPSPLIIGSDVSSKTTSIYLEPKISPPVSTFMTIPVTPPPSLSLESHLTNSPNLLDILTLSDTLVLPESPNLTDISNTSDLPNLTDISNTSDLPNLTDISNTTESPNLTDISNTSDLPNLTDISNTTETPNLTDISNTTETPNLTDISNTTESPNLTVTPESITHTVLDTDKKQLDSILNDHNINTIVCNLEIIRSIKQGDKLCVSYNGELSIDTSYVPFLTRALYGNNRHVTIDVVINTVIRGKRLFEYYPNLEQYYDNMLKTGINNLIATYHGADSIQQQLRELIQ